MADRKKINHGIGMALGIFAFSFFVYWQIAELPAGFGSGVIGPSFFPTIMNSVIVFLTVLLLLRSIWHKESVKKISYPSLAIAGRMAAFLLLLLGYARLYETLGFFLASAAAMVGGLLLLGERRILYLTVFPACVIGIAWVGFAKLMKVALPTCSLF